MFLVDTDLKKRIDEGMIIVDNENPPFDPLKQIGASTIDLRLGRVFRKYKPKSEVEIIDLTQEEETVIIEVPLDGELILQPGELCLGLTVEVLKLPTNISGFIATRSSIARLGLSVVE